MTAIDAGFGVKRSFGNKDEGNKSDLILYSADTTDGNIDTPTKNPLFSKSHKTVKREGKTPISQSNIFYADIDLLGSDSGKLSKLADAINQVITKMENYKDDNGKFAGVAGAKTIVAPNDPHLKAAIETVLAMDMFKQGETMAVNPAYKRATLATTPYLADTNCCGIDATKKYSKGFFIVDKSYNAENHGPELTERVALTLDVIDRKEAPKGIKYEGRQRFDINVASWRGIAYVYIGTPSQTSTDWNYVDKFEKLTLSASIATPVNVMNTVNTKEQA